MFSYHFRLFSLKVFSLFSLSKECLSANTVALGISFLLISVLLRNSLSTWFIKGIIKCPVNLCFHDFLFKRVHRSEKNLLADPMSPCGICRTQWVLGLGNFWAGWNNSLSSGVLGREFWTVPFKSKPQGLWFCCLCLPKARNLTSQLGGKNYPTRFFSTQIWRVSQWTNQKPGLLFPSSTQRLETIKGIL